MSREWFIEQDGKSYGPYSSGKLKEMAKSGSVTRHAKVANTKDGPWHAIHKMKGLAFPDASPPPPPQPKADSPVEPEHNTAAPDGETVIWTGRPSQITNIKTYILCALFCWLVVPVFVAFWKWLQLRCLEYHLTTERLKISMGVFSRQVEELELYRVKDTSFSQTFFQRIFGLATIGMTTSDVSHGEVWIQSIPVETAKDIREKMRSAVEDLRDRKRVREVDYV